MALGWTQPLTGISLVGKVRPESKADNLTAICKCIIYKMWEPRRLTAPWASTASYKNSFTFTVFNVPE
jgi:hypothetical protein